MKLLVFDLDGTLIDEQRKTHAPELKQHFVRLKAAGHRLALITGRFVVPQELLDLVQPDAWATGNGNRILLGEHCVAQHALTPTEVQLALDLRSDLPLVAVGSAIKDRPVNFVSNFDDPRWEKPRKAGHILPLSAIPDFEVLHLMFMGKEAPIMRERLLQKLPDLNITGGIPPYLDCVNVYADRARKHLALQQIAGLLQVPLEQTIAFGDSDNDIEMLQTAGHAVQVGDMPYLTDICQERVSCPLLGLPAWLERFLQAETVSP